MRNALAMARAGAAAILAVCVLALLAATPAQAHRLRIFATVEQGEITGYAYFVGGARAKGASVVFLGQGDRELHRLATDDKGAFRWKPEAPQTVRILVDAGEGHVGSVTIDRRRFSGRASLEPEAAGEGEAETASPLQREMIEAAVEAAVARQVRPLLEAFEAMEARTRFNDVMGGIGMIVGLAGAAMWALARRRGGAT